MKQYIFYKKENIYIKLDMKNVLFVMAEGDYVSLSLKNEKAVLLRDNLKRIEEQLPSDTFFRTHRSWLVNLAEITTIDTKGEWLQVAKQKIPISRTRRDDFFEKISKLG